MKKLLSLLAVLAIVLSCSLIGIGTVAFAAEESSEDDFLVFDGVLEEYVGAGGDVVIPASLGIKEIAAQSFYANEDITSIVFPEGVEVIGYHSLNKCTNLAAVTLPYTVEEIAEHCFSSTAITEITIPANVKVVGYGTFSGCVYLEEVTLSYGVEEIMPMAFQGTAVHEIVFPETVELICGYSFMNMVYDGKYEYTICNPDCEVGPTASTSQKAYKHQWETNSIAFHSAKYSVSYELIVPKDSEIYEYFKSDDYKALCEKSSHAKDDSYNVKGKDASYFEALEQNQESWGLHESTNVSGGTTDSGDKAQSGNDVSGDNGGSGSTTKNPSGDTQYVVQGADNSSTTLIIIVVCVFGGIMLIAIIAVVILAATGKLFGGKKKEQEKEAAPAATDIDALKAQLLAELKAEAAKAEEPADETTQDND